MYRSTFRFALRKDGVRQKDHKMAVHPVLAERVPRLESTSAVTSWKGLNILCRYKRVSL
jgi:hypothetical protein